jgi:hypothetical protein
MQEIWKDIKNYEGYYQVSNLGRVKSLPKFHKTNNQYCSIGYYSKERILKPTKKEYARVILNKKAYSVHRLVAEAFIPNPNNYPIINHKDGNKQNNKVNNLEWCTQSHNQKEAYRIGLKKPPMHNLHKTGKLSPSSIPVNQFNKDNVFIKYYDGISEASRQTNILTTCICACCKGRQKTAGGFIWRYADK